MSWRKDRRGRIVGLMFATLAFLMDPRFGNGSIFPRIQATIGDEANRKNVERRIMQFLDALEVEYEALPREEVAS